MFDLNREVSSVMAGREPEVVPSALLVPQSTYASLPVRADPATGNGSRFALPSENDDPPMSTSELMAFIAQQRGG